MELDQDTTRKLVDGIKIPPAPYTLQQIQSELLKDDPSLIDVANIISHDVGISALVLKTVNSPFFGLRSKVHSISHAASLLGLKNTVNIVAGLELQRSFQEADGANPPNFWDSPSNVAMVAASVARSFRNVESDVLYMLGLFHNSGHALMTQKFPEYGAFLNQHLNSDDGLITDLEEQQFETNHAILGYFLARSWGIDKDAAEVIRDHHHVHERLRENGGEHSTNSTMLAILKIAEHIDKLYWGMDPDHEWEQIEPVVLEYLGWSKPDYIDLQIDMLEKLNWNSEG